MSEGSPVRTTRRLLIVAGILLAVVICPRVPMPRVTTRVRRGCR